MTWHLYASPNLPGAKSWEAYTLCGRFVPLANALPLTPLALQAVSGDGVPLCEACRAAYVSRQLAIEPET